MGAIPCGGRRARSGPLRCSPVRDEKKVPREGPARAAFRPGASAAAPHHSSGPRDLRGRESGPEGLWNRLSAARSPDGASLPRRFSGAGFAELAGPRGLSRALLGPVPRPSGASGSTLSPRRGEEAASRAQPPCPTDPGLRGAPAPRPPPEAAWTERRGTRARSLPPAPRAHFRPRLALRLQVPAARGRDEVYVTVCPRRHRLRAGPGAGGRVGGASPTT